MNDISTVLFCVCSIVGVAATGWWLWRNGRRSGAPWVYWDVLAASSGNEYPYCIGDDVVRFVSGGWMRGISIELPADMPHIYLDSQKGGGRLARFVLGSSQKLSLEGDFDRHFRLYVPAGYQDLALSIITPDVMQAIMDNAEPYDVEIVGNQLRLLTDRAVYRHPERQARLLAVAGVVLKEADERLRTWSTADANAAADAQLILYPYSGVRVFGIWLRLQSLLLIGLWSLLLLPMLVLGAYYLVRSEHVELAMVCLITGVALWLIFFVMTVWLGRATELRAQNPPLDTTSDRTHKL
jgi:hypothetical protein